MTPPNARPAERSRIDNRIAYFLGAMAALAAIRLLFQVLPLPLPLIQPASLVVTVVFMLLPIHALFVAAGSEWNGRSALLTIVGGAAVWALGIFALQRPGPWSPFIAAIGQQALPVWCLGLGAAIALLIRDRNMLVPIAIFLALFDMWLVFAPEGVVNQQVVQGSGKALATVGYAIPAPQAAPKLGLARSLAYVGPADYLFLAMFFVCLHRFGMRVKETYRVAGVVLLAYLAVVLIFGKITIGPISLGALPALVPIGLTVLIMNRREFKMAKDEVIATAFIAIAGTAFVSWRILAPRPPVAPVIEVPAPAAPESAGTPAPTAPSPPR